MCPVPLGCICGSCKNPAVGGHPGDPKPVHRCSHQSAFPLSAFLQASISKNLVVPNPRASAASKQPARSLTWQAEKAAPFSQKAPTQDAESPYSTSPRAPQLCASWSHHDYTPPPQTCACVGPQKNIKKTRRIWVCCIPAREPHYSTPTCHLPLCAPRVKASCAWHPVEGT